MSETNSDRLNRLYKEYGLVKEDVFSHKFFTIITRGGIDKIQAKSNIKITYEVIHCSDDLQNVLVKATGQMDDKIIETFGEASPKNTTQTFKASMAEKRAMSRVVLKLTGFYAHSVFGEDEADKFKRE